jgi:diguanylate cyclase (GGDEF)-like protein
MPNGKDLIRNIPPPEPEVIEDPVVGVMNALLPVHRALTIAWLADATATAAERALGAPFTFLFFEQPDGKLDARLPASDLRRRSLQRAIDALEYPALGQRLDPANLPALAEALEARHVTVVPPDALFGAGKTGAAGVRRVAVVPLETAGERLGAMLLLLGGEIDRERAQMLGEHVACAAVNLRTAEAARDRGVTDAVRSVFDARKLETDLQRELARAQRYKRQVAIVVIEATNLRLLREQFGRFLTDRLLQRMGETLAENARDVDILGAYKESGYTMILAEAQVEGAAIAARRMLATALQTRLEGKQVPGLELHLVAGWASCPQDGTTSDTLFAAAEQRMYDPQVQAQVA